MDVEWVSSFTSQGAGLLLAGQKRGGNKCGSGVPRVSKVPPISGSARNNMKIMLMLGSVHACLCQSVCARKHMNSFARLPAAWPIGEKIYQFFRTDPTPAVLDRRVQQRKLKSAKNTAAAAWPVSS